MPLVAINDRGQLLEMAPANAFDRMEKAAGRELQVTSAWRSAAEQQMLYDGYVARKVGYNFALPPDKSEHVKGMAIDTREYTWMEANAHRFGFIRTDPRERWHYAYRVHLDEDLRLNKIVAKAKDSDMLKIVRHTPTGAILVGDGIIRRPIRSIEELSDLQGKLQAAGLPFAVEEVEHVEWLGDLFDEAANRKQFQNVELALAATTNINNGVVGIIKRLKEVSGIVVVSDADAEKIAETVIRKIAD